MSADNWAICPKCDKKRQENIETLTKKIHSSYGKVSEEEYNNLKRKIVELKEQKQKHTLREEYEIGTWEGEFEVHYNASCSKCRFEYSYKHSEQVKV